MASLGSVKTSLGHMCMLTSWASKQEAGYIHTVLSEPVLNAELLQKYISTSPFHQGKGEVWQVFR